MGFRFRKSFGKGPFRVTVSKSGVGYSVGTKGFRYTKKAGGGTRTTASIPGTGISYVTETGAKKSASAAVSDTSRIQAETYQPIQATQSAAPSAPNVSESNTSFKGHKFCPHCKKEIPREAVKCPHCGKRWPGNDSQLTGTHKAALVIVLITAILGLATCSKSKDPAADIAEPTFNSIIGTEATESPTAETPAETAKPASNIEEIFGGQGVAGTGKGEKHNYIYNTNTGIFHEPGCRYVEDMEADHKAPFTSTREDAIAKGYDPCDHCNP